MIKKVGIKTLFTLFLAVALLVSCNSTSSSAPSGALSAVDSGIAGLPDTVTKWAVEPSLEMDNVRPVVMFLNEEYTYDESQLLKTRDEYLRQVSIVEIGGKFGLIDLNGNIVLEVNNAIIFYSTASIEGIFVAPDRDKGGVNQSIASYGLDADYKLTDNEYDWLSDPPLSYFWDAARGNVIRTFGLHLDSYDSAQILSDQTIPVPVYSGHKAVVAGTTTYAKDSELFGYGLNDKLLLEPQYKRGQYAWEDIAAVSVDGDKWQYVRMDGTYLNEHFYDAVTQSEIDRAGENNTIPTSYSGMDESGWIYSAYDFSEGLVAVCRDGLWGYMDKNGVEVIACQYEESRPVYQGKAWVKVDGVWGVADLSDYVS